MEFKETWEKDKGPVVRWLATTILDIMHKIESPLYPYARMWEAVFDEEDQDVQQG